MATEKTADAINQALGADDPTHITSGKQGMDNAVTEEAVKEILKHGTPDWVTRPNDYKDLAREDYARTKENSDMQVREYRMPNQQIFTDAKARMRNPLSVKELLTRLRAHDLRCCVQQNKNSIAGTAGLYGIRPGYEKLGLQLITTVQVPAMWEWSVLREDAHGLPVGEKFIGWRNVCAALIVKGFWSEEQVHKVFGRPPQREFSSHYFRTLWEARNILRPASSGEALKEK